MQQEATGGVDRERKTGKEYELMEIAIVDYGMGNLRSIQNMLKKIGIRSTITADQKTIVSADGAILPGVGHFAKGMDELKKRKLISCLNDRVEAGLPVLGICLGIQLMTAFSEEGDCGGLNWFPLKTVRFQPEAGMEKMKVPHMGWNRVEVEATETGRQLFQEMADQNKFYFVHSYRVQDESRKYTLCRTKYGVEFASGIVREHIVGVQFHPEKSHRFGRAFFEHFIENVKSVAMEERDR